MSKANGGQVPAQRHGWTGMHGRRVLVTGGSRGLGEQIVRLLLDEGARVGTCARTATGLEALVASVTAEARARLCTETLDVMEPGRLEEFVTHMGKRFGNALDGVVACVGGSRGGRFEQAGSADWAATWDLNVGHTVRLVRAALPYLRAAGGGSVVVIASVSGWKPGPPAQYGVAKSAQIHLAGSLARELGPDGIRVNAVSPGSMLVPGRRWDRMRTQDPEAYAAFARGELPGGEPVVSGAHLPVDRAQNAPSPDGY
ncbi:SDR family NAD(P)-dependent oxidoreductase [Streptomyces sp. NPDC002845]